MNWLPTFLNWQAAAIAAGLAIPALLILYFLKLRRQERVVPSTLLWRKAIQDLQVNSPFQKLRRNLLLLLQLIVLLLLLLALSRPVANYKPGPGKTTVILIDRSASMAARDGNDGRTRLEEAQFRARELVRSMSRDSTAMVIAFDSSAETMQGFTSDQQALIAAIDRIRQTDRKTDLRRAYALAEAQVNFDPEQLRANVEPPDVRLYSDGRTLNEQDLRIKAEVTYEPIGSLSAKNIAVVALSAKRNYERPTEVQVFARLANFGPEPVQAPVTLSVDGQMVMGGGSLQSTYLLPERWTEDQRRQHVEKAGKPPSDSVQFKLDLANRAIIRIEQMNKDGDQLAADDVAHVVVPPPKVLAALLVSDGNYFLERVVRSLGLQKPDIIIPQAYEAKVKENKVQEDYGKYDVIIFDNYRPPTDARTGKAILPDSGSFIYFGVVPDGIKTKAARMGAATQPGAPGTPPPANAPPVFLDDMAVMDWDRDHPILANLALNKLYAAQGLKLQVPLDREVLIEGLKGPMMVLDRDGRHTHLIVAFNLMESNWPLKVSFPVFMHQALHFLALGADMALRQSYEPGDAPQVQRSLINVAGGLEALSKLTLEGPGGTREVPVPPGDRFVLPPLEQVGIYKTVPEITGMEQIAVNMLDVNESNLVPAEKPPGDIGKAEPLGGESTRRRELWPFLAAAALAVLFIEWWVYTRRVHL